MTVTKPTIAVLGGTGQEGSGIALRFAHAGHRVLIGSRDAARAAEKAADLNERLASPLIEGRDLPSAAGSAEIVVLSVPYAAQQATARQVQEHLRGKILIDVTVPLVPPKVSVVQLPDGQSCVKVLQSALGEEVRVVSAFQNVSAHRLLDLAASVDCDVLVCADDAEARATVCRLIESIGMTAIDAGVLANSVVAESLTSVLIWINRTRKVPASGIRITGLG